jgi:hypothetical protein
MDFDDGIIYIEGPPDQVKMAQQKLSAEIGRLGNEYCSDVMHVAPHLHRHVIGRSGALGECLHIFKINKNALKNIKIL